MIIIGLIAITFVQCNSVELQESCKGEWSYFVGDTAYCELLISDAIVFPYHYKQLNGYSYNYKIENDTFYIYGNREETVEMSPINYLGPDSFQILGITPATLTRIKHEEGSPYSLSTYNYKMSKILKKKDINQLLAERAFSKMNGLVRVFEEEYLERRNRAIYRKEKKEAMANSE